MKEKFVKAIDNTLSGLQVSPESKLEILQKMTGGTPVKKKMPLALALALSLLLITFVAFAAVILGGKDVVDQKIAPMAQKNDSRYFTKEEVEEILAFAKEHGIELEEYQVNYTLSEEGYFKDELAILFAKDQLGVYPGTWSVEDQYWYAMFWQNLDPDIVVLNTLPQEGELSQDQIEAMAAQEILARTGKDYEVLKPENYTVERSFTALRQNPWHVSREWMLTFIPKTLDAPLVNLTMNPQGEVLYYMDNLDLVNSTDPATQADMIYSHFVNQYDNVFGSKDAWTQENWQDLKARLEALKLSPEQVLLGPAMVLRQGYTPPVGAISREQAIELAAEAVSKKYLVDKAALLDTVHGKLPPEMMVHALYLEAQGQQRYKVSFNQDYLAEVDALTGEIMVVDVYSPGNDYDRRYILDALLAPEDRAFATPYPSTDLSQEVLQEETQFFPADLNLAPQWYWDQLQALGYSGETATGIYNRLEVEYSNNERYWPVLYQAMHFQRNFRSTLNPGDTFPGLPHADDLQLDAALALAREAMVKEAQGRYPDEILKNAKPVVFFTFNLYEKGSRTWQIDFVDLSQSPVENPPQTDLAYVKIDAITGLLIEVHFPNSEDNDEIDSMDEEWSLMGTDGRPRVWRDPVAPEAFWELMEEKYNDRESVEKALAAWEEEYTDDLTFWPDLPTAVNDLWRFQRSWNDGPESFTVLAGIPMKGDLKEGKIEELAWAAFKELGKDLYTQEDFDSAVIKATFYYSPVYPNGCIWQVEFVDTRLEDATLGILTMDGKTGEVLSSNLEPGVG